MQFVFMALTLPTTALPRHNSPAQPNRTLFTSPTPSFILSLANTSPVTKNWPKGPVTQDVWTTAFGKELGGLAQGDNKTGAAGTDTVFFMTHDEIQHIPKDRTVTYARVVVDYCPQLKKRTPIVSKLQSEVISLTTLANSPPAPPTLSPLKYCGTVWSVPRMPDTALPTSNFFTSPHQWIATSTCECPSASSQNTSLTSTTSAKRLKMVLSTWKFGVPCTASRKQAFWPTSYSKSAWPNTATTKLNTPQDFGLIFQGPSSSPSYRGRFWNKVCWQTTRRPPVECAQRTLHH
jgi:hypothetical protein